MTTREFIYKRFYLETNKTSCSSVLSDSDGNIYSYGYHYPLLFTVADKTIRNVKGYSNTTQRHIMRSRDVPAIDVHVPRGFRLTSDDAVNLTALLKGQREYVNDLHEQLKSKKRKDTQVYRLLERQYAVAVANLAQLTY